MLFYLSCLLKASLSFIILTKFISDFTVDTSLIVFTSLQIILLDYIIFKDNDTAVKHISFSLSYLKKLERYLFLWSVDNHAYNNANNGAIKFKTIRSVNSKNYNRNGRKLETVKTANCKSNTAEMSESIGAPRPGLFAFTVLVSVLSFFCGSLFFFVSPLYSHEHVVIPDLKGLKQYSAGTNFMSFDGYLISYFKIKYNKDISRGEARKIIKDTLKNKSGYAVTTNDAAIDRINSVNICTTDDFEYKYNQCIAKLQNTIHSLRAINSGVERHTPEILSVAYSSAVKIGNTCSNISRANTSSPMANGFKKSRLAVRSSSTKINKPKNPVEAKLKRGTKCAVLLPFKNKNKQIGGAAANIEENAIYGIKNYLAHKGFCVISGADVAGVCFNLDKLDKFTINELSAKFDADYIITGSIDAESNAYLKVIDASNHKLYNSLDCLN